MERVNNGGAGTIKERKDENVRLRATGSFLNVVPGEASAPKVFANPSGFVGYIHNV
jgi:hypothetical protein